MSLTVETGVGIEGAEAYATVAFADTYWSARTNDPLSAIWSAATTAKKEGALRSGAQFLDSTYGPYYKGKRRGQIQGLLFPRSAAKDEDNFDLPDLPEELKRANVELAARALSAPLSPDVDTGTAIKSTSSSVGPLSKSVTYADPTSPKKRYGVVEGLLASILTTSPGGSSGSGWGFL